MNDFDDPAPSGRRWWIPAVALGIPTLLSLLRVAFVSLDIARESWFFLQSFTPLLFVFGMLVVLVWFFFLARFSTRMRVIGLSLLTGTVSLAFACIGRVEFDGNMNPRIYFRWEKTPEQLFAEHQAQAERAGLVADFTLREADSPGFRGRDGLGITLGVRLADDWSAKSPRIVWKHACMDGLAGIAVAGDSVVTIEQRAENETIVCYDRETGNERWATGYPAKFSQTAPMGGSGPRTTPVIHDGEVYSLGGAGDLTCHTAKGEKRWHVNILQEANASNVEWGLSGSPVVVGKLVVAMAGSAGAVAYDRSTGKRVWMGEPVRSAYASPLVWRDFVVIFDSAGLAGLNSTTGATLWRHPWKTPMDMNSAQPLPISDDTLFISSEQGNGCAAIKLTREGDQWKPQVLWQNLNLAARYASPVFTDRDAIYGLHTGALVKLSKTGKRIWKEGNYGNGQILLGDQKLIIVSEKGKLALVDTRKDEFEESGSFQVFSDRTWNMPALAGNRVYMRNHREIACVELP